MKVLKTVYICAIKLLGFPFVVETEDEAKLWVEEDPEEHYYNAAHVKTYN